MVPAIRRYEQIAGVLVKYGFEVFVKDLLPGTVEWRLHREHEVDIHGMDTHMRIRLALQELGPAFVKLGQIMSTRREILPPGLVAELAKLTDRVEPLPFDKVKPVIEDRCGLISETFKHVDEKPIAAASLSQAHLAELKDGTRVVLKIQRPGIREVIETDVSILEGVAERAEKVVPNLAVYNLPGIVKEFARQIRRELDFVRDGKNADLIARNLEGLEGVRVPKIYWEYSCERLLTMEYIQGVRIDDVEAIRKMGHDPKVIAVRGFKAYLKQIFEDGFFHGDPHPGNLLVTSEGDIVFLDFGLVGILRPERRDTMLRMLVALTDKDVEGLMKTFQQVGISVRDHLMDPFKDDLYLMLLEGESFNPEQPGTSVFQGLTTVLNKYHIRVPLVMMLTLKVIIQMQDDGLRLYPEFNFMKETRPYLGDIMRRRVLSQETVRKTTLSLADAFQNLTEVPQSLNATLKMLSGGTVRFKIAHDDLDRLGSAIDRATYKLLLGIVVASIVVGLSLVVFATHDIVSADAFRLTLVGYGAAVIIGVYSLYRLVRQK
jgi:ubiquinone biosynthesis protein